MASQVLTGNNNPVYTNSTGQNVRVVINYMASCTSMSWAGTSVAGTSTTIVRGNTNLIFPTEIFLANGTSFSAVCGTYNLVVIKEDGS